MVASGSVTSGWQPLRSRPVGPTTMVRAVTSQREGQPEPSGPRAASSRLSGLLRIARPRQWVKNLLVFAAPAAAGVLSHGTVAAHAAGAFGVFCLAASGTLLRERHPRRRGRPPPPRQAPAARGRRASSRPRSPWRWASVLMAGAIGLAWVLAGSHLAVVIAVYVAVTTAYSMRLKHEPVIDLACVSSGFVLRAIAGGVATGVPLSDWFLIVSSFGALLIVTGKRSAEHPSSASGAACTAPRSSPTPRRSCARSACCAAAVTVTAYCLWAFERSAPGRAGGHHPIWFELSIVPVVLAILHVELRFARGMGGAPEELALRDRTLQLLGLVWVVLVAVGIYA